jgi:hypothetical protein
MTENLIAFSGAFLTAFSRCALICGRDSQVIGWDRGRPARNERVARKRIAQKNLLYYCKVKARLPRVAGETPAVPASHLNKYSVEITKDGGGTFLFVCASKTCTLTRHEVKAIVAKSLFFERVGYRVLNNKRVD